MMGENYIGVTLTVLPDTKEQSVRVIETLATMMTGLALEGIDTDLKVTPYETEEEDADD